MRSREVSALPVVGSDGRVIGIVSEADLLLKEEGLDLDLPPFFERRRRRKERAKARGKCAEELMTSPAVTVGAPTLIAEAARIMHHNAFKRLPVVDDRGRLLGIVSRADLIKVFLRSDEEIEADVENSLALSVHIHPSAVLVSVVDGVVRLEGRVKNRSEIASAMNQARRADGVVAVECELDFEVDDEIPETWSHPAGFMGP
jgi:predicted transcriptional regulator